MSETWLINENPDISVETFLKTDITGKVNPLTGNNTYGEPVKMYMIGVQQGNMFVAGTSPEGFGGVEYSDSDKTWKFLTVDNQQQYTVTDTTKLRTITFDTAPIGELLTWLQANAVKQGEFEGPTKTLKTLKVNGKVFSKVNNKYLKNLNDSPIFAAKKAEVVSAGETWLINENPDITVETFLNTTITGKLNPLTANNTYGEPVKMYMIGVQQNQSFFAAINAEGYGGIMYGLPLDGSDTSGNKTWKFVTENLEIYTVEDTTKLRTITFDTAPTGELLTWLQANAVKQ